MIKETWHGYEAIHFSFEDRDAFLVFPETVREGAPWALKTEYRDAFTDVERRLLAEGFHVAFLTNNNRWATREECDAKARFVRYLSETYQLSPKCVPVGMSCGGAIAVKFAGMYPELISCMFIDAPGLNFCSIPGKMGNKGYEEMWDQEFTSAYPGIKRYQLPGWREHPICFTDQLVSSRIPVILVYGKEDQTVLYNENGLLLQSVFLFITF